MPTSVLSAAALLFSGEAFAQTSWWKPTPGTSYQIQLDGTLDLTPAVQAFDLDLFDTPAETIAALRAKGVKVVCYFSAGTYENWRDDKDQYTAAMYGKGLPEWKGEYWVDTRNAKVREIIATRMALAKAKGCDAVDPDNVDAAFNDSGFALNATTQLDFNRFLATTAHGLGLAVGLKNDVAQVDALAADFDFAVNEQCFQYNECEKLLPFVRLNKPVLSIEYSGVKTDVCAKANALNFDTLFKTLALQSDRYSCRETGVGSQGVPVPVPSTQVPVSSAVGKGGLAMPIVYCLMLSGFVM